MNPQEQQPYYAQPVHQAPQMTGTQQQPQAPQMQPAPQYQPQQAPAQPQQQYQPAPAMQLRIISYYSKCSC